MQNKLFLDDYRHVDEVYDNHTEWKTVRTYQDFILSLSSFPDEVSFDFDLSGTDQTHTGLDCARVLCKYIKESNSYTPKVRVHSGMGGIFPSFESMFANVSHRTGKQIELIYCPQK